MGRAAIHPLSPSVKVHGAQKECFPKQLRIHKSSGPSLLPVHTKYLSGTSVSQYLTRIWERGYTVQTFRILYVFARYHVNRRKATRRTTRHLFQPRQIGQPARRKLRYRLDREDHPKLVRRSIRRQNTLQTLSFHKLVVELGEKGLQKHNHLKFSELAAGAHVPAETKHLRDRLPCSRITRTSRGRGFLVLAVVSVQEPKWTKPERETRARWVRSRKGGNSSQPQGSG